MPAKTLDARTVPVLIDLQKGMLAREAAHLTGGAPGPTRQIFDLLDRRTGT